MGLNSKLSQHPKFPFLTDLALLTASEVDAALCSLINNQSEAPSLREAMKYAALNGGKRFRPLLIRASGNLFDIPFQTLLPIAVAAELIHAYSLVHDDLPPMDNADMRRGKASCWRQFDEATAILVGDALLTLAFEVLASSFFRPEISLELIAKLAKASGPKGMVGGQMLDIDQNHKNELDSIKTLQRLKTGELIAFCAEAGAIVAEAEKSLKQSLKEAGYKIGLIYQVVDDLLDQEGLAKNLGKPVQQDINKKTLIDVMGIDQALSMIHLQMREVEVVLSPFGGKADLFKDLLDWSCERES